MATVQPIVTKYRVDYSPSEIAWLVLLLAKNEVGGTLYNDLVADGAPTCQQAYEILGFPPMSYSEAESGGGPYTDEEVLKAFRAKRENEMGR